MEKNISLLIKPASGNCNMNCRYCFYRDVCNNRNVFSYGKMSNETVETIIQKTFAAGFKAVTFAFQGGEPTLTGIDFYKFFLSKINLYNKKNIPVYYSIQTNGYNLSEEWATFFADNNFLVGVSLDGTKDIHNHYRTNKNSEPTFSKVLEFISLLKKYEVNFNILTVVTPLVAKHIDSIYSFYKKNDFKYLQFIPYMEELGVNRGESKNSLTPDIYADFLKKSFNRWYQDLINNDPVYIRYFNNILAIIAQQDSCDCSMQGFCQNQMIIEADGSVYPCDFYVLDEYRLGNLLTDSISDIIDSGKECYFLNSSKEIHKECRECQWYLLCRNGCRRDRVDGFKGKNYFCEAYKSFFEYAVEKMCKLVYQFGR